MKKILSYNISTEPCGIHVPENYDNMKVVLVSGQPKLIVECDSKEWALALMTFTTSKDGEHVSDDAYYLGSLPCEDYLIHFFLTGLDEEEG